MYRYQDGEIVKAKRSGKFYRIWRCRSDDHPKLKGEVGYSVIGRRGGADFGPVRLMRESALDVATEAERGRA